MKNYAGNKNHAEVDKALAEELELAGIKVEKLPDSLRDTRGEVQSIVLGTLHGWVFTRNWYYWVAKGPGIPCDVAMALHAECGDAVRVDGDCRSPSPLEIFKGLGCGAYHVDSQIGLKRLADAIKSVVEEAQEKQCNQTSS